MRTPRSQPTRWPGSSRRGRTLLETRGLAARCQMNGDAPKLRRISSREQHKLPLRPADPPDLPALSRATRDSLHSQVVEAQPGIAPAIAIPRCARGSFGCEFDSVAAITSCRLLAHPIDTKKLSTMPMATISSQLVLFFIPTAPHRCLPIGPG